MVTLILVSHSYHVAQGVRELAAQMAPPQLRVLAVGGLPVDEIAVGGIAPADNASPRAEWALGTDAQAIVEAIDQGWSPVGVLILVDLGSSILSAETALDLLPPEKAAGCLISNAPFVEGAIIAAVEAGLGHDLTTVNRAAEGAATLVKVTRYSI